MDGPKIRNMLKEIKLLHRSLDDAASLPSELMAFYRTHFNIPFAKLFRALARPDRPRSPRRSTGAAKEAFRATIRGA